MRKSKYTKDFLQPIVAKSRSISEVLRELGLKNTGGNYRNIQSKIKLNEINTSHFSGQAWSKGLSYKTDESIAKSRKTRRYTNEEVFCENSPISDGSKLSKRLLELGWTYECSICCINEWQEKSLTLHVDHIDGNRINNNFYNLRFLCPNCHQQTETWGNKKKKAL